MMEFFRQAKKRAEVERRIPEALKIAIHNKTFANGWMHPPTY
jgi:hypothetical protein